MEKVGCRSDDVQHLEGEVMPEESTPAAGAFDARVDAARSLDGPGMNLS
jgi:hypothetical protein